MNQEIVKQIQRIIDDGNLEIHVQVSKLKNLLLAGEHAATYAEEQRGYQHEPPNWPVIFKTLGELTNGIRKAADDLLETVFAELDKSAAGGTHIE